MSSADMFKTRKPSDPVMYNAEEAAMASASVGELTPVYVPGQGMMFRSGAQASGDASTTGAASDIGTTRPQGGSASAAGGVSYTGNQADELGRPRAKKKSASRDILG